MQTEHLVRAQTSLQDTEEPLNAFGFPDEQKEEKMSQSFTKNFFMDDPFFTHSHFLWPRPILALSSFREDFLQRRAQLIQSLRNEIRDGLLKELSEDLHREFFQSLDDQCSSSEETKQNNKRDLSLTLDTQGFSPEDATVTISGERVEVMGAKQTEKEGSSSSTSTNADSQAQGFVQAVELPDHLDPATLTCSLGEDGLLHLESQESKEQMSEEHVIPIRFRTSLNFPIRKDSTNKKEDDAEKSN
ncbi:heat shock protein beta-9 [Triplophysa rosa]|uniref:Heat shock protein n=1 Tax=Triplophysa rosa TaxID=992332 RepID=A0A9W7TTP9_TRIRA|nr:heat shock protein beta-9 [Triplophysa rosa]KAI7803322.1 heat shock protein [Triplophysa rosa]